AGTNVTITGSYPNQTINASVAGGSGDMSLAGVQTVTAAKTFNSGTLKLAGSTSGTVTLNAPAIAGSAAIALPSGSGTLLLSDGNGSALTGITVSQVSGAESALTF